MNIIFTRKARDSLLDIGHFLLARELENTFVRQHLNSLNKGIVSLLTTFPEAGIPTRIGKVECRKVIVKGYSVLYQYLKGKNQIAVLLVYRENLPTL